MIDLMIRQFRLTAIKSFLQRVLASVDEEYSQLINRNEANEFEDHDDFENALYLPMQAGEIACRAVYYELNALVESNLQGMALAPFTSSESQKTRKKPKIVSDLKRPQLQKIIQDHYNFYFDDLPGSNEIEKIKEYVNAHKHRGGYYSPNEMKFYNVKQFPARNEVEREEVLQSIESVEAFFRSVKTIVEK